MFGRPALAAPRLSRPQELEGILAAIDKSQALIEFTPDGTIITANGNFLQAMGYALEEIQGHHHRMFVDPAEAGSAAYHEFWAALKRGEYQAAEYKRIGKDGREVWIQASYNPILDQSGRPMRPSGQPARIFSRPMPSIFAPDISVSVHDGAMQLTRMRRGASSWHIERMNRICPPLAVA